MPLSQPLGALLTLQHSMFAQSFGSRIRGRIVNYSRSFCAPQPTPPPYPAPNLLLTHLHGDGAGICFLSCIHCQLAPSHHFPSSSLHLLRLWASNQKAAGGSHMVRKFCDPLSKAWLSLVIWWAGKLTLLRFPDPLINDENCTCICPPLVYNVQLIINCVLCKQFKSFILF